MPNPLITIGAAANDGTGELGYRAWLQKVNRLPVSDSTINAGSGDYTGTTEQKITAAIAAAVVASAKYVWIPQSMLPYNASLVTFNVNVRMVREGGNPAVYDASAYGAVANGTADDTVAIQAALNGAAAGNAAGNAFSGIVVIPPGKCVISASLTPGRGAHITGSIGLQDLHYGYCSLQAAAGMSTPMIELGTAADSVTIENIFLFGVSTAGCKGIHVAAGNAGGITLQHLGLNTFGSQAIHNEGDNGGSKYRHIFISAAVLATGGLAAYTGAFDVKGECMASDVYANCNISGAGQGVGSGFVCAAVIHSSHGQFTDCQFETAQTSVVVASDATWCKFTSVHGNKAQGNNWIVAGAFNQFVNCAGVDASLNAANASDAFNILSTGIGNQFTNCAVAATIAGQLRHGFTDATTPNQTENSYCSYINNRAYGTALAGVLYNFVADRGAVLRARRASGDRGDNSVTIQADVDADIQFFNTPLTTNRTVTLSATGARHGAIFRIVRTAAATGGSTLSSAGAVNVGKALTAGQWVEYEWTGSFSGVWMESAFGSL